MLFLTIEKPFFILNSFSSKIVCLSFEMHPKFIPKGGCWTSASYQHLSGRMPASIALHGHPNIRRYGEACLLSLPWFCPAAPTKHADGSVEWLFVCQMPREEVGGASLEPIELRIAPGLALSFEQTCADVEREICRHNGLVCSCCAQESQDSCCRSCRFAVGFHHCEDRPHLVWRKGTLYGGALDIQRVLFNLHRKGLPTDISIY